MIDERIVAQPVALSEKRYRGCRGPDKCPRKININSMHNLKPFQQNCDNTILNKFTNNPSQKQGLGLKFLIVFIILGLIITGYLIWKYFKEKHEEAYNSDNLPNIFETENSYG